MTRIIKFGGTSLEHGVAPLIDALERCPDDVVLVVSAIGDTTDQLAQALLDNEIPPGLAERLSPQLVLELQWLLREPPSLKRSDAVLALGERHSAAHFAAALRSRGYDAGPVDARSWLHTDSQYGQAQVDLPKTYAAARRHAVEWPEIPVVTGYIGIDPDGHTTTLGRGGSDYTATLLGAALDADCVEICTDVHGVMTADPRVVPEAQTLASLSFADAVALARAGARVLHPHTLDPLRGARTEVWVRHGARSGPATRLSESITTRRSSLTVQGDKLVSVGPQRTAVRQLVGLRCLASAQHDDYDTFTLEDPIRTLREVHRCLFGTTTRAHVFLLGAGGVGTALLEQLAATHFPSLRPVLVGVSTRSVHSFRAEGIDPLRWRSDAHPEPWSPEIVLDELCKLENPVLVDCTASLEVGRHYSEALRRGIHVVAANKVPFADEQPQRDQILHTALASGAQLRYETTVGAAVPVVATLHDLLQTGDRVDRIEGSLSGTLAYLCACLSEGKPLRQAVEEAVTRGYTEPRPQDDLAGTDVARKALILARELGLRLNIDSVQVEPLSNPVALSTPDVDSLLDALEGDPIEERARQARQQGKVLRYLAVVDPRSEPHLRVGPVAVGPDHPAYAMPAGQALVAFTTARYGAAPLVVQGAGAGCEITAAGLLADVLRVAREAGQKHGSH